MCWFRGKVTTRVFLLGWNFLEGLRAENFPHKEGVGFQDSADPEGGPARARARTLTHSYTHARVHTPRSYGLAGPGRREREEGAHRS